MKKVLSSILISFIIFVNLLAPFSVGWGKSGVEVNKNEVRAEYTYSLDIKPTLGDKYIKLDVEVLEKSDTGDATDLGAISLSANLQIKATVLKDGEKVDDDIAYLAAQVRKATITLDGGIFSSLDPGTPYKTKIELIERLSTQTNVGTAGGSGSDSFKTLYETTIDTPTVKTGEQEVILNKVGINGNSDTIKTPESSSRDMPECGLTTPMGCVAQFFYYTVFVPTSYLFALAGTFFDTTFAYSVQDTSYRSAFVVQGWGLVRDFCNIFFIFVLLYVAIGTTLSLHTMKTKETIINVVIIGLFINFSLFATQLIIDASNITARVFYNADTIKLEEEGANGVANLTPGLTIRDDGVIPLSAGIVNKVNPQNLIFNSKKINNVPDKGTASSTDKTNANEEKGNLSISSFILITLLASAVNIVGFIVFLSVGMMFVVRIVGLWIAMILAPLAFFTYILPEEMAGIKMIGWKNWWPETLKLAFLAPVFIFFMYIILKFLSMDLISDIAGKALKDDGLSYFISILMPFAFIMVLLMKSKGIAKDMAGEMGEFATKMGSAVGGAALGGAVGLGAMAMRGTLGRFGSSVANSDKLKAREAAGGVGGFIAKMQLKTGEKLGGSSFDARNTKAGAAAGKGLGVDMGKAKEGGYTKMKADQIAESQKRVKELEKLSFNSPLNQDLRQKELTQKKLENKLNPKIEVAEQDVTAARQRYNDLKGKVGQEKEAEEAFKDQEAKIEALNSLKNGGFNTTTGAYNTDNGLISQKELDKQIKDSKSQASKDRSAANASGIAASEATANENTVRTEAATAKTEAEKKAVDDENTAITSAATIRADAEKKAAQDESIAIATAKKAEIDAIAAASTADMAVQMNGSQENKDAAKIARDQANAATANVKTTESNAILERAAAETKAINDENTAKTAAAKTRKDAETKAADDYAKTIKEAEDRRDEAIIKATADESTASASEALVTTAETNKTTLVNSGQIGVSLGEAKIATHHAHQHITDHQNNIKEMYATSNQSTGTKVVNMIMTGGEYSPEGADEASHNIRMDVKSDTAGGGGH